MLAFLLALVPLLFDSPGSPPAPIDGYTVASPSGAFELFVLPDDREAQAGAEYVLSEAGHALWSVHHDFALREAYVTDAGVSGGFALTDSKGTPARASGSYLVVATLAEDGTLRHSEWTATFSPPDPAPSMTPPPQVPLVSGMQVLPNAGRMILALDVRGLYWRAYDTTTGERVALGTGERVALGAAEDGGDAPVVDGLEHSDHLLGFDGLKRGAFEPKVSAEAYVGDVLLASEHRSEELVEVVALAGVDMVLERWLVSNGYEAPRSEVVNLLDGEGRCIFRQVSRNVYPSLGEIGPWTFDAGMASHFVVDTNGSRFTKRRWLSKDEFEIEGTWDMRQIDVQGASATGWELVPVAEPAQVAAVEASYDPTASALRLELISSQRAPDLQNPQACAVLRDGRVAVYDALAARLSIWDPTSGAVLHVDASGADGFGLDEDPRLAELADGRVRIDLDFAMDAYPELTWSPGSPTLERRTTADAFVRTPDGRFEWEWRYPGIIEVRTTEGAPVRTIERHGKGLWFNGVSSIWFAADGSVWVKEGSSGLTSHAPHLVHYTPDGTELDAQLDYGLWPLASGVVFDGALAVGSRGSSKSVLIENPTSAFPKLHELLDLPTGPATLPDNAPGELWLFELETLSLHRYKLPAELLGE